MSSAREQADVVERYLQGELASNRIIRVQDSHAGMVHCSLFGVIPKRNKPNKWRLIVDLSTLDGHSVNNGISKDLTSLSYV